MKRYLYLSFLFLSITLLLPKADSQLAAQTITRRPAIVDASSYSHLQAAFDAVPVSGGLVMIPPGDYEIEKSLVISTDNTRIQGSGAVTHIININESGEPALIVKSGNPLQWRVELSNFRVSGNQKSGDGIYLEKVQELFITGLSIDHNGQHGIRMHNCTENPRIANCNLTYNAQAGINIYGGHDIIVSANQFEENQDALRLTDGFNLTTTGNNIDDHLRHGIVIENVYGSVISGIILKETSDITISGNSFCGLSGEAVKADAKCNRILVAANLVNDANISSKVPTPCFDLGDAQNSKIENNIPGE